MPLSIGVLGAMIGAIFWSLEAREKRQGVFPALIIGAIKTGILFLVLGYILDFFLNKLG